MLIKDINTKIVITDYNHLPQDLSQAWFVDYSDNYIIYDRANRWEETDKIKKQINVGENIYDMFDFIVNNYDNLPNVCIFVKADVIPRHCGIERFENLVNNKVFTPIEQYEHVPEYHAHKKDADGGYMEINNSWYLIHHPGKYFRSYNEMLQDIYINPEIKEWTRFSPGGNYLIPKETILRYSKNFYKKMREYCGWAVQPGEAFILERMMITIFTNNYKISNKYE